MILGGLQKLTLIDYPGKIAATVFTVGCNFRCPFCHNPELVVSGWERGSVSEDEFFAFLDKRKGKLEGVCITGGEPTIQKDIVHFIKKIKKKGFLVKLDSNGTRPDVLKKLLDLKVLDFIAMDIKSSLKNYKKACGTDTDTQRILLSVDLIRNSRLGHEFRTTVVPGIHTYQDFRNIAQWLKGNKHYALQAFQAGKILDMSLGEKTAGKTLDLEKIKKILETTMENVIIR